MIGPANMHSAFLLGIHLPSNGKSITSITIRQLCLITLVMPFDIVVLVHHHYL